MNKKEKRQLEEWKANRTKQQTSANGKRSAEQLQKESMRLTAKLQQIQALEEQAATPAEQARLKKAFEKTFKKLTQLMYSISSTRKPELVQ